MAVQGVQSYKMFKDRQDEVTKVVLTPWVISDPASSFSLTILVASAWAAAPPAARA